MDIQLTLINDSDADRVDVVIFQKNRAASQNEPPVAWKVINRSVPGKSYPFIFPEATKIASADAWGNFSPLHICQDGQLWYVKKDYSGDTLQLYDNPCSPNHVEMLNSLVRGSISAHLYKNNQLLALKSGIAPQQKAVFEMQPRIWVGVVSQVEEGQVMKEAIVSAINTEISFLGITKANIIMTGGGPGENAMPFKFTLEPIA